MKKIYYIYFTALYRFYIRFGESDIPQFFSILFISMFMGINILAVFSALELILETNLPSNIQHSLYVTPIILNYFLFIHRKKYRQIVDEYSIKSKHVKLLIVFIILTYMIISIYAAIYFGSKIRARNMVL